MAVFKRKTDRGESAFFHYKFMKGGKYYFGVCEGCRTKKDAEAFEGDLKKKVGVLVTQKNVKALVENFRDELTGGDTIKLRDAFELSLKKPRKRTPSANLVEFKRSYWRDFLCFMDANYSDCARLTDVHRKHAEEYIQFLREKGRYDNSVEYRKGEINYSYRRKHNLSNKTVNTFHQTLAEVFQLLSHDAGLMENPFSLVPKLDNESETREAFTEEELRKIGKNADAFLMPLFVIGITTALREGDICLLTWNEVDLKRNLIARKMLKTRRVVEIPILPPLHRYLLELKERAGNSEYVLPEHAAMYLRNRSGISWRVKRFLESLGIKTTKKSQGRTRAISVKDIHSLRHSFCYYAGVYGVPFLVVKDIVGHVTPEMTALYQKHADNELKRRQLANIPDFMGLAGGMDERPALPCSDSSADGKCDSSVERKRWRIIEIVKAMDEITLDRMLETLLVAGKSRQRRSCAEDNLQK